MKGTVEKGRQRERESREKRESEREWKTPERGRASV